MAGIATGIREMGGKAVSLISDTGLIALGSFAGRYVAGKLTTQAAMGKAGLELGLGLAIILAGQYTGRDAVSKFGIGVGADGIAKVLEEVIP